MEKEKYTLRDIIKISFDCDFKYALAMMFQKILQGLVPTLQVITTAKFLDVAMAIVNGKADYNEIFLPLTLVIVFIAYNWISSQLIKLVEVKLGIKLREKFRVFITEKRAKLKYKHIENKDTWDLISRVAKDPEVQYVNAYKTLLDMASLVIRILGILLVLVTQVWWSAVIILAVSIPLFALALKSGKANYEVNREVSKYKRKYEYLKELSLEEKLLMKEHYLIIHMK